MTNEEMIARFLAMEARQQQLEAENSELKERVEAGERGAASGMNFSADSQYGNFHGMSPARSVTIATRPVIENPNLYARVVSGIGRVPRGNDEQE